MVEGLKLLYSKNPNALNLVYERYYDAAVKEAWGDRKPNNAVGDMPMPIELMTYYGTESSSVSIDECYDRISFL